MSCSDMHYHCETNTTLVRNIEVRINDCGSYKNICCLQKSTKSLRHPKMLRPRDVRVEYCGCTFAHVIKSPWWPSHNFILFNSQFQFTCWKATLLWGYMFTMMHIWEALGSQSEQQQSALSHFRVSLGEQCSLFGQLRLHYQHIFSTPLLFLW